MPEQRRRFSPQFKAEAVQMVLETGKPIAEVARDLEISEGTLGNWVKWGLHLAAAMLRLLRSPGRARAGRSVGVRGCAEASVRGPVVAAAVGSGLAQLVVGEGVTLDGLVQETLEQQAAAG